MLFNSYIFILVFLPVTVIGFYMLESRKYKNIRQVWLIAMSAIFCCYYSVESLAVVVGSIGYNYGIVRWMECMRNTHNTYRYQRHVLFLGIAGNVAALFYYKYMPVPWPMGLSFFTFSQISFLVDSYRAKQEKVDGLSYVAYITYFPKFTSGPIARYGDTISSFRLSCKQKKGYSHMSSGLYLFAMGLCKKVLVADSLATVVTVGYAEVSRLTSAQGVVVILAYTAQIYYDFSGYCDMAVGISQMLGIELPINFNSPYKATSITDFWKRWHMTLSQFFTQYLYIPLGGNRKGLVRTLTNTIIIFLISGLWHGSNWTFIVWGFIHGVATCVEKCLATCKVQIPKAIGWLVTFLIVNVAWVYFRAESIGQANSLLATVVTGLGRNDVVQLSQGLFELVEFRILERLDVNNILHNNRIVMVFVVLCVIGSIVGKNNMERFKEYKPTRGNLLTTWVWLVWGIVSLTGVASFVYLAF